MRYHEHSPFVPITRRPPLRWPNNARVAVWIVPNIEYFDEETLGGVTISKMPPKAPDIVNYSWHDYGMRHGVWRIMDIMKRLDIPGTVALNALVCDHFPEVVDGCTDLGWEIMGHGLTNSRALSAMEPDEERETIATVLSKIEKHTGKRPIGWLGSGLQETPHTLEVLARNGIRYVGDWINDDQPYPLHLTDGGTIMSVPYSIELNDIGIFLKHGFTGNDFEDILLDQFTTLYEEGAVTGKVMCIALHPYITGAPFRARHLAAALAKMREYPDVWFATGSQILAAYEAAVSVTPGP